MTESKPKKPLFKKAIALKNLATAKDGNVKKGEECTCTNKEFETFKKAKAI
jgi:hypothetical protein